MLTYITTTQRNDFFETVYNISVCGCHKPYCGNCDGCRQEACKTGQAESSRKDAVPYFGNGWLFGYVPHYEGCTPQDKAQTLYDWNTPDNACSGGFDCIRRNLFIKCY